MDEKTKGTQESETLPETGKNSKESGEVGMKEYIVQAYAPETIATFDAHNAPEIVRCEDCKYKPHCAYQIHAQAIGRENDWFCADGKRRTDDG